MKIFTQKDLIKRFLKLSKSKLNPETVTVKEMEKLFGIKSGRFFPICSSCNREKNEVVILSHFRKEIDIEEPYFVCEECLKKALDLIE